MSRTLLFGAAAILGIVACSSDSHKTKQEPAAPPPTAKPAPSPAPEPTNAGGSDGTEPVASSDPQPPASIPEYIDARMISAAVKPVRAAVAKCTTKVITSYLTVQVGPNGRIQSVQVRDPDPAIDEPCLTAAFKHARFPTTQKGGSFTSPFMLRPELPSR